jgi:hypothetical protein
MDNLVHMFEKMEEKHFQRLIKISAPLAALAVFLFLLYIKQPQ